MAQAIYKQVLNERLIRSAKSATRVTLIWDADTRGLVLAVRSNGRKTWKFIYSFRARTRWFVIGDADAMPLSDARKRARELRVQVDQGSDPQALRSARRGTGTFAELALRSRGAGVLQPDNHRPQSSVPSRCTAGFLKWSFVLEHMPRSRQSIQPPPRTANDMLGLVRPLLAEGPSEVFFAR